MKSLIKYFILTLLFIVLIFFLNNIYSVKSEDLKNSEIQIKNKTADSIFISFYGLDIPENTVSYNMYSQDILIGNTKNKEYNFTDLNSETNYTFKVEFLDSNNNVLGSKSVENLTTSKTIDNFNESKTYPKDTYYINAKTIPTDIEITFEAGSILKFAPKLSLSIYGTLNLNGTEEEKVLITSSEDTEGSEVDLESYWSKIYVNGTLNLKNTIFRYGGVTQNNRGENVSCNYIENTGTLNIDNLILENMGTTGKGAGINGNGNIKIINTNDIGDIVVEKVTSLDIQDSKLNRISARYTNQSSFESNINIERNEINENVDLIPTNGVVVKIKDNKFLGDYIPVEIDMYYLSGEINIFDGITGNVSTKNENRSEIYIYRFPDSGTLNMPKKKYKEDSLYTNLNLTVNMEPGVIFVTDGFTVGGVLNLNGTEEEKVIITSTIDEGNEVNLENYWSKIYVNGTLNLKNTIFRYGGVTQNNRGENVSCNYIENTGTLNIDNLILENMGTTGKGAGINGNGNIKIINTNDIGDIVVEKVTSLDIQDSKLNRISARYTNQSSFESNINIERNEINENVDLIPTNGVVVKIKDNKFLGDYIPVEIDMYYLSGEINIFDGITGNVSTKNENRSEIHIYRFPASGTLNMPKKKYKEDSLYTDLNLTVNMEPGVIFVTNGFTVGGVLNLNGTEEEKVIITSETDEGNEVNLEDYWDSINISTNGILNINNTELRYGGVTQNRGENVNCYYINNKGTLNVDNLTLASMGIDGNSSGIETENGDIKILNSANIGTVYIKNANNIELNDNKLKNISINYSLNSKLNNIKINNNILENSILLEPNLASTIEITNNSSINSYPVKIIPTNAVGEIFKNIKNNKNTTNNIYNSIYIEGIVNNHLILTSNNSYNFGILNVAKEGILEIKDGITCKFEDDKSFKVDGVLIVDGTQNNNVNIKSIGDENNKYFRGLIISDGGMAFINNLNLEYAGKNDTFPIENKGALFMFNSSIQNSESNKSIFFNTRYLDQMFKYNNIVGDFYCNMELDATNNYWNSSDGPAIYNFDTGEIEGNGSVIYGPAVKWDPYNNSFIKTNINLREYIEKYIKQEKQYFGVPGVNDFTGNYSKTYNDLEVEFSNIDLSFTRTYNSKDTSVGILGRGWTFGFSAKVVINPFDSDSIYVYLPNGQVNMFTKQVDGTFVPENSRNTLTLENGNYVLISKDQTKYKFNSNKYLYQIIDKYSNVINITVNNYGLITTVTDSSGRRYNLTYNSSNRLEKIKDPLNREVKYFYTNDGLLSEVEELNGKSIFYEYDNSGYLINIKEEKDDGNIVLVENLTYSNDSDIYGKRLEIIKTSDGKIEAHSFNKEDNVAAIVDQNLRSTLKYFDSNGYVIKEVSPNGMETNATYNLVNGQNKYGEILSKTEITGATTSYIRDNNGNILKQTNPDGSYKTYEYNNKNSIVKEIDEVGNITTYNYSASDGVTLLSKGLPNGATESFEYSTSGIKGLITKKTNGKGDITTYQYDNYGNLIQETDSKGNIQKLEYNILGWLTKKTTAEGYVTTYEYDNSGNMTKVTEPNNIITTNYYNYKNNLIKTVNANGNEAITEYDDSQRKIKITDEQGNIVKYKYDIYGNIIEEVRPNGAIYKYEYNNMNQNTKAYILKDNKTYLLKDRTYEYNLGNTIETTKSYFDENNYSTNVITKNYLNNVVSNKTENAEIINTYYANGLLLSEQNQIGKRTYYTYNSLGKVASKYEEVENNLYKLTKYLYDNCGNMIQEKTSNELVLLNAEPSSYYIINYVYDGVNNLTSKSTSLLEETIYTYDKDNNVIKEQVKIQDGKYKTTEYEYTYAKKVKLKKEYVEKSSIIGYNLDDTESITLNTSYEYDNMNNLVKLTDSDGVVTNYKYDKLNREIEKEIVKGDISIKSSKTYLYETDDKLVSSTNENGQTTTYEYDNQYNLIKTVEPNNTITTYQYDLNNHVLKKVLPKMQDKAGNDINYTYDKYGNLVSRIKNYTDADGVSKQIITTYEYDLIGNIIKEKTDNVIIENTYNKAGEISSTKDGNENITSYNYDANLNLIKKIESNGCVTDYLYDSRNNLLKEIVDNVVKQEYTYDLIGNNISSVNELGKVINYTYNLLGNIVKQEELDTGYVLNYIYSTIGNVVKISDNQNKVIEYEYDILDNVIKEVEKKDDNTQSITVETKYDNLSNVIEEKDGNGNITKYEYDPVYNLVTKEINPKNQAVTYEYDKNGNLIKQIDYLGNTITYEYDNLDRAIKITDQYNNVIQKMEYDNLGRQIKSTDANNNSVLFTYDNNDNILTKTDEESKVESYEYDSMGNVKKYIDKNGNTTSYNYDNIGNLLSVENALGEITTYEYDNMNNLIKQTDASGNITTFSYNKDSQEISKTDQLGNIETRTYYSNGNLKTYTTNNNDTFTYEYDIHDRLIKETVGEEVINYEYDNNSNQTKIGNLIRTYDNLDRILTQTRDNLTVEYTYNDNEKTLQIKDPKGNITKEVYDKANRLQKVINSNHTTEYEYNVDGSLKAQKNPTNIIKYTYNTDKSLQSIVTEKNDGQVIDKYTYTYDNNNNILKENNKSYTYDSLNRLNTVTENGKKVTYTYDNSGNILEKTEEDEEKIISTKNTYNEKNQLISTKIKQNDVLSNSYSYTYDKNGNMISSSDLMQGITTTNIYNARNELIQVKNNENIVASYFYNEEGKRISKTVGDNTTKYIYDGNNLILELDKENNELATNTYGINLIKRKTDKVGYYIYNSHGDISKVVDVDNNVLNEYKYDEYGKITQSNETFNNPFKYTSYYYDDEIQNYYLNSRYYDPQLQRFISEDTYRGTTNDPLSLNLYTYCVGNPLMYKDNSGNIPLPLLYGIIGGSISVLGTFFSDILDDGKVNLGLNTYIGAAVEGTLVSAVLGGLGKTASFSEKLFATFTSSLVGNTLNQYIRNFDLKNNIIDSLKIDTTEALLSATVSSVSLIGYTAGGQIKRNMPLINKIGKYGIKGFFSGITGRTVMEMYESFEDKNRGFEIQNVIASGIINGAISAVSGPLTDKFLDKYSKKDILKINKLNGENNEKSKGVKERFSLKNKKIDEHILLQTEDGKKSIVDSIIMTKDGIVIKELKSSKTAPLTKNQKSFKKSLVNNNAMVISNNGRFFHKRDVISAGTKYIVDVKKYIAFSIPTNPQIINPFIRINNITKLWGKIL